MKRRRRHWNEEWAWPEYALGTHDVYDWMRRAWMNGGATWPPTLIRELL